jgi:hypothetical protein
MKNDDDDKGMFMDDDWSKPVYNIDVWILDKYVQATIYRLNESCNQYDVYW